MNKSSDFFSRDYADARRRLTEAAKAAGFATRESNSHSTRCQLEANPDAGLFRLWYWYNNRPRAEVSHRSAQHQGAAWLEMDLNDDRNRLRGQYFTTRRTSGDLDVKSAANSRPRRRP